tara:strand:+ start:1675 stop:2112 length:438 start_codon:yes stop_codon:yes gene_type:complete
MELAKIEALLDAYFEGNTSLAEETTLRAYFNSEGVAPHLEAYRSMFVGFETAKAEVSERDLKLPTNASKSNRAWWYSIAASLVIAISVGGYIFNQPSLSQEEKDALAAFQQSKEAMLLLSSNFNKGTEQLTFINEITETKNKILK